MEDNERFNAMAEACLTAHEAVADVGTPAMFAMTRALLWQIGQELAQREARREEMLRHSEAAYSEPSKFSATRS
ncbi:hypothetical protein [Methylobacterium sp. CM6244]